MFHPLRHTAMGLDFVDSSINFLKKFAMSKRKLILSMQITLDGFVAGPNDEADWLLSSDEEWKDLNTDLGSADTFLLGRKMYPLYSRYWQSVLSNPNSAPMELEFAKRADNTRHIVFTKGDFKPDWKIRR